VIILKAVAVRLAPSDSAANANNPPVASVVPVAKPLIDLSKLSEVGTYEEKETVEGVCQHNITWDRLGVLKRENPKLFLDELYIFVQQYVVENVDHDYVCKSCGFFLNIKKFLSRNLHAHKIPKSMRNKEKDRKRMERTEKKRKMK
jgi:hypothetical protein